MTSEPSQARLFADGCDEPWQPAMFATPQHHDQHPGDPKRVRRFGTTHGGRNLNDEIAAGITPSHSSQPLIPANHSLSPGSDWARRMTAHSGARCAASLPTSGPVLSWLRTLVGTSRWASTRCWLTWKRSATPAGRSLYRLVPSMPSTAGIASGFWPTPNVPNGGRGMPKDAERVGNTIRTADGRKVQEMLHHAVERSLWPTQTVQDAKNNAGPSQFNRNSDPLNVVAVKTATRDGLWTTPCADDTGHRSSRYAQGGTALSAQAGGKLHGRWTLALMGFPPDWCDDLPPDPLTGTPT